MTESEIDDLRAKLAIAEAERDAALARARQSEAYRAEAPILEDAVRIVAGAEPGTPALALVSSLVVQRDCALTRLARAESDRNYAIGLRDKAEARCDRLREELAAARRPRPRSLADEWHRRAQQADHWQAEYERKRAHAERVEAERDNALARLAQAEAVSGALVERLRRAVEVIRNLEHVKSIIGGEHQYFCGSCAMHESYPHKPDCALAAVLRENDRL